MAAEKTRYDIQMIVLDGITKWFTRALNRA